MPSSETTFLNLLPETVLILWATLIMVGGAFVRARAGWPVVAVIATLLAASALVWFGDADLGAYERTGTSGPLILDALGSTMRWLGVALGLLLVLTLTRDCMQGQTSEILGLLLLLVCGMMITCWADTTILLFLGLELISIPTYVLLFVGRDDDASAEAATKYFFLSILSSTFFLLGLSLLFGLTGTTQLSGMSVALAGGQVASSRLLLLATIFVFTGLGFKLAAVPFHFYAPDVYQATTNGNAAILAVIPKIAGLVALIRILAAVDGGPTLFATQLTLGLVDADHDVGKRVRPVAAERSAAACVFFDRPRRLHADGRGGGPFGDDRRRPDRVRRIRRSLVLSGRVQRGLVGHFCGAVRN